MGALTVRLLRTVSSGSVSGMRSPRPPFGGGFETVERGGPEGVEIRPQRFERGRVYPVDAARAVRLIGDEARIFQHFEVLRHRRTRDGKVAGEVADGRRA